MHNVPSAGYTQKRCTLPPKETHGPGACNPFFLQGQAGNINKRKQTWHETAGPGGVCLESPVFCIGISELLSPSTGVTQE